MNNDNSLYLFVLGEELVVWLLNKKVFKVDFEQHFEGISPYARTVLLSALDYLKSNGKIDSDLSYFRRPSEITPDYVDEKVTTLFSFSSFDVLMPMVNKFIESRLHSDFDDPLQEKQEDVYEN